jgi:para-nitrobenzyl esterase
MSTWFVSTGHAWTIIPRMRKAVLVLVAGVALASPMLRAQAPVTVALSGDVKVAQGQLSGVPGRNPAITAFKGVPFAAPPVGDLRWREPRPAPAWQGTRAAADFSLSCVQNIVDVSNPWTYEFMAHGAVSEDCLYLNVWTPARTVIERRPVFVYIHGGANREGSGSVPAYDGEGLASRGLVVVTINYRLGVFGFFAHPEATKESPNRASGNYGLLDQIAAVKWVKENIAAFGGDPDNITIAGQSAGASAVHNITASPLARGLFHRAIAQSGSSLNTFGPGRAMADQEADGVRFAALKGAASLAALRAMSAEQVFAPIPPASQGAAPAAPLRWTPVVDGYALPASVGEIFRSGRQNDVVTMTGANADESGASTRPTATAQSFVAQAKQRYGDDAAAFLKLYPAATDDQAKVAANTSARDIARMSMYLWALERAKTAKTPVYTYYWTHTLPGPDSAQYGAFHTSEVPYLLNTLSMSPRPFTAMDHRIADLFSTYVVNFATTGDPNGGGLPRWNAVSASAPATLEIGGRSGHLDVTSSPAAFEFLKRVLTR